MPTWKLIFYAVSALMVALLLYRMYRKNRVPQAKQPLVPNDTAAGLGTGDVSLAPPSVRPAAPQIPAAAPEVLPLPPATRGVTPPPLPAAARTKPAAATATVASVAPATATATVASVAPAIAKAPTAQAPTYSVSAESRAHRTNNWSDRALFTDESTAIDDNPLPSVAPHEVPIHGDGDYQYGSLTPTLAALLPETAERQRETRRDLKSAGRYEPHALENFNASRYLLMMLGLVGFGVILLMVPPRFEGFALFGLIAATIAGWGLPRIMLRSAAAARLIEIERAMPDMLDMLNMCVSQGLTVQESLGRVSHQMKPVYPALAQELQIVHEQSQIGSLEQAMENFSDRIDLPEVHSFTTLITQTERMGTSVSQALANYSDTMRENLRQRADEKANRATFRLLFPTVLFLMPAVFIILLGPALVELSDFFAGRGRQLLGRNRETVNSVNNRQNTRPSAPSVFPE